MKKQKAFTLIELLLAIAIIGLLSSIVLVGLARARYKADIAKGLQFSGNIKNTSLLDIVGEWNFEGNLNDSSVNGRNATDSSSTITYAQNDASPELDQAGVFDGLNTRIVVPFSRAGFTSWTIEAWVYCLGSGANGGFNTIINFSGGNYRGFYFYASWPDYYLSFVPNFMQAGKLSLNRWHHVVLTYNKGSDLKSYIDGNLAASSACDTTCQSYSESWAATIIGASSSDYDPKKFHGMIDGFKIYAKALNSAEIKKHYSEGLKEKNLAVR